MVFRYLALSDRVRSLWRRGNTLPEGDVELELPQ